MKTFILKWIIPVVLHFGNVHFINAQVVINEILASNTSTNLDDFDKNFSDWVELYNSGNQETSIGGWYLTDDKNMPNKWEIPFYYSISPNGYILFWLDNLNTSNHANFKLRAKGETIYLYSKNLVLIDSLNYPQQYPDISYGRIEGTPKMVKYLPEATPLKQNSSYGFDNAEFTKPPLFSKKAGFYTEAFNLEISGFNESDRIYYTLDGTLPGINSLKYEEEIEITKNTVVRARAYSDEKLPGKVTTQTYLFEDPFTLPVFSLTIDSKYLWDKEVGFYVQGISGKKLEWEFTNSNMWEPANYFEEWERPINVEYFDKAGNPVVNFCAGARIHGRSSRTYSQKSLAIFLRKKYGTSEVSTKFFGEKSPETIKSFLLRNGGNDWGMTMFLDGLVHTLVYDKIDIDAQLYQPALVFLNGEYWGIHNIREKINKNYIKTKVPKNTARLDIIETDGLAKNLVVSSGNFNEYDKMIEFIENNELSKKENYDTICKWVDTNELINYLITEVYISNRDWPQSNMKFWKYSDNSSKWRWVLYDTEYSFREGNKYAEFNMFENMLTENSEYYITTPCSNYLIRKLFENEEFESEFVQRMAVYLYTVFDSHHVLSVLDSLKKNIEPEINRNFEKWGGIKQTTFPHLTTCSSNAEWEANIDYIKRFVENRPQEIRKNMAEYFNIKDTVYLKLGVNDKLAGNISIMGYSLHEGNFNGYVYSGIPIRLKATPRKGYRFVRWKGGEYEKECIISLDKNKKLTAVFEKIE